MSTLLITGGAGFIGSNLVHYALAHTAGTVRQTVNRVLRSGVREGVLEVRRNEIRVVDRVAVAAHGAQPTL